MLGFPYGWVDVGVSRTSQLRLLGNSVQVQIGALMGLLLTASYGDDSLDEVAA